MTNFLEVFFMCKKKFSGVLLLLLLLVSCFVTASAGTAEAWGLVAIERQGNKVYQHHLSFLMDILSRMPSVSFILR